MKVVESIDELAKIVVSWRTEGKTIGLVPTMGWFHQGHLSLMEMMRRKADKVVVSLFVNPKQFGQGEDLSNYPHDLERDRLLAEKTGIDVLFAPKAENVYPEGFQTTVSVHELTRELCGASRPGHFDGVATVVTKLFNMVQPHLVIFGEKDYQQLAVVRRMVRDLNFNIEVLGHPIVREADGLAMSSRNTYLSPEQRENALCLYRAIQYAKAMVEQTDTELRACDLVDEVRGIINATPDCEVDYVAVVDKDTLLPSEFIDNKSLIALAVKVGDKVRLIDNAQLALKSRGVAEK
jgi:pantoate--beta-alanine ligase